MVIAGLSPDRARVWELATNAARRLGKQPSVLGVMMGSEPIAEGMPVRLLVLLDARASLKEAMELDGVSFDLWQLPRQEAVTKLNHQRDAVLIKFLIRGKVLFEQGRQLRDLIDRAKDVYLQGPLPISRDDKDALRWKLTRMLAEIRGALDRQAYPETALLLMNDQLLTVIDAQFRARRWWPTSDRYYLTELRKRDPRLYTMVLGFLKETDPARKFAGFARIVTIVLDGLGGSLTDYSSPSRFGRQRLNMLVNPAYLLEAAYRSVTGQPLSLESQYDAVVRFIKFLKPYRTYFIEVTLYNLIALALLLPLPFLTRYLFDSVLPHRNYSALYAVVTVGLILGVGRALLGFLQQYYVAYLEEQMNYDINFIFYRRLFLLSHTFYDEQETGQIIFRFQDAMAALSGSVGIILNVLNYTIAIVVVPIIAILVRWDLAVLAAVFLPINAAAYYIESVYIRKYTNQVTAKRAEYTARNYEAIAGVKTILALNLREKILHRLRKYYLEMRERVMRIVSLVALFRSLNEIVAAVSLAVILAYAWSQILNGQMTVGELMAFTMVGGLLYYPIISFISLGPAIQRTMVRSERFFRFYDVVPDVQDQPGAAAMEKLEGPITFDRVSFEYEMGQETLRDLSVTLTPGTITALVGPPRSGKTTFASLVPRFYDPTAGTVSIGELDLRRMTIKSLRSRIGFVGKDDYFFAGSILENLKLGKSAARYDEIVAIATGTGLHQRVMELPMQYDTPLTAGAANLSGGERKLLAITRALLADPYILILDESMGQLDPETEQAILTLLTATKEKRITILIAHRLASVKQADQVLVFDDGRVVETGVHDDLFKLGTRYYRLFEERSCL